MATIRELWQLLRTHRLKRRVRWAFIALLAMILVVVIGGVAVKAHDRQTAVSSSSSSSAVSSSGPSTAEKKADLKKSAPNLFRSANRRWQSPIESL
ncbi:hypothetical protein [Lacticaseibacillus manihotivorans]|uniref:hypothetical protein n=1 Tax=Lacticaseibacillus manihotivorans TaxID=88233 RepID=UPI0006CFF095|nr:hypothetical protein [Lacticaseibacillus manihotivorans]